MTHPLTILLVSMSVFMCIGVPISFSLILCSLLVIWVADLPLMVAVQQMFTGVNAFTLLVPTIIIPLSGALMSLVCLMDIARDCRQIWTGETPARPTGMTDVA